MFREITVGLFLVAFATSSVVIAEAGDSPGEEGGCDGHYTVQDACSFLATGPTVYFWASACSLGSPVNCYGQSMVYLEVFVDGEYEDGCSGVNLVQDHLAPAWCSGEVQVAIGAEIECKVTGTAHNLIILHPHGYYKCQTPSE